MLETPAARKVTLETLPGISEPVEMEHLTRCVLCGSEQLGVLLSAGRVHSSRHTGPKFTVSRCEKCGLTFTNPRPTSRSIGVFYDGYFEGYIKTESSVYARRAREVTQMVGARGPGRVFDVGCGTGTFLAEMERLGWSGVGLEPDSVACEFARREYGLAVKHGTLESVSGDEQFDMVTLWHTLEHVHNPVGDLRMCHQMLKPGGVLVVEVPNFGSLQARCFGSAWYALMLPEHLWHFTPSTLTRLLEMCGFSASHIAGSFDRAGWGTSVRMALSDFKYRLARRTIVATRSAGPTSHARADNKAGKPGVIDAVQEAMNVAGHFVESRLLRYRFGTLAMRAVCQKRAR